MFICDVLFVEVDLVFILFFLEKYDQVVGDIVLIEELYVIFFLNYLFVGEEEIVFEQFKDDKFVLFSKGYLLCLIVWYVCLEVGFMLKIVFEGEEMDIICGLVVVGMGVSLLLEMVFFQINLL